jgi:hypothetical protein
VNLTISEQATLNFYQWEYRHRGYYHFDTPVDIEVPYIPFYHTTSVDTTVLDDGRVPSLFKSISNLLSPPKTKEEPQQEIEEVTPRLLEFGTQPSLVGLSVTFAKGTEILPSRNTEFLNMLTFSEHLLSFEIVGASDEIQIQIVCSDLDIGRVQSHFSAYFPAAIIKKTEITDFDFSSDSDVAIADFGLHDEYMRPITTADSFSIDPLTSVIATMESLQNDDIAVFQILFKGITSPLAKDITYAVSDGAGGSFFADAPEMPLCAKTKISNPLFSVVMRIDIAGFDSYEVTVHIVQQSPEIAHSVDAGGAGDQGIIIGYACNENIEMIPQEFYLAKSLCDYLYQHFPFDGKTQITINENFEIEYIVASFQNSKTLDLKKKVQKWIYENGIKASNTLQYFLNPAGEWNIGGFAADAGVTGRKIVIDSYGPRVPVGGGAFSGKDWTKVDRSGAKYAQDIAQQLLTKHHAAEVRVELAYAIGISESIQSIAYIDNVPNPIDEYDCSMEGIHTFIQKNTN